MADVMTVEEVAEFLRCHKTTVYRLLRTKRLIGFRIGSDWRFSRDALVKFVTESTTVTA